ncbi:MAG: hypothetical protein MZV63_47125 [Marinilabiliales bacterium]|nr:hypothetical protein [Marinilabiliales bacterium]
MISVNDRSPGGFEAWKVKPVLGSLLNMTNEAIALGVRYKIHTTKDFTALAWFRCIAAETGYQYPSRRDGMTLNSLAK